MQNIEEQKKRLEQKKARMQLEETRLKLKERKARTRHLIEIGGLVTKAGLDDLPTNTLYGALLSLSNELKNNDSIRSAWSIKGNSAFNKEKQDTKPVILSFTSEPIKEVRDNIRSLGLRFNKFRKEWCGNVKDMEELKTCVSECKHELEILEEEV